MGIASIIGATMSMSTPEKPVKQHEAGGVEEWTDSRGNTVRGRRFYAWAMDYQVAELVGAWTLDDVIAEVIERERQSGSPTDVVVYQDFDAHGSDTVDARIVAIIRKAGGIRAIRLDA